jgi:hypothetical protein
MNEKNEKNLVPAEEIEVKSVQMEVTTGIAPASLLAPRTDLAGLRVTPLTGGPIYVVSPEGYLQWIPNPATYSNLFRDWNGVHRVDTATLPIGNTLSDGAVLAKGNASDAVYLVSNGRKRWITSPSVMDKYHFNWSRVYVVPQVLINSIPTGNNWS